MQFENDYVRVVRVHYDAGAKLPEHTHPGGHDGVRVSERLGRRDVLALGGNNRAVTRPAVKAGAIRIAAGPEEHHTAENTSSTPSDFLRIVFQDRRRRREEPAAAPVAHRGEFGNKQMRITRLRVKPGQNLLIEAKDHPTLRIALREGVKQWTPPPPDLLRWLDKGTTEEFAVTGDFPVDIIRIDFLTKPKD